MNFLQIAQMAHIECGMSGTGPVTTVGQVGEAGRLTNWVASGWTQLQLLHPDWKFLRKSTSFQTVAGQAIYSPLQCNALDVNNAVDLNYWDRQTFRNYVTATGYNSEIFMGGDLPYDNWRDTYQFGANRNVQTRPIEVTITPNKSLGLGPVPAVGYTITGDYFAKAYTLVNDTDIPTMPDQFHQMIVYAAMMSYGIYEGATEVYQRGELKYNEMLSSLVIDQLPDIRDGGALA